MVTNRRGTYPSIDPATKKVIDEEFALLGLKAGASGDPDSQRRDAEEPVALCLSGGGIRSATFSLGVLQGLAQMGRLKDFHYLSTVSGGGYIGAWLSVWIRRVGFDKVQEALRESAMGRGEAEPIRWLRRYSNFLAPVRGWSSDSMTLIATFARNLILHWLILIPILALVLLLPRVLLHCVRQYVNITETAYDPEWLTIIVPTAAMLSLWLLLTLLMGIYGSFLSEQVRDKQARLSGGILSIACLFFIFSLIVIKLPIWILELDIMRSDAAAATASIGGAILAIGSALAGYWSKQGPDIREKASTLAENFGVKLLEISSIASMLIILLSIALLTSAVISIVAGKPEAKQAQMTACESAIPLVLDLAKTSSSAASLGCHNYIDRCGSTKSYISNFWLNAACEKTRPEEPKAPVSSTAPVENGEDQKATEAARKSEPSGAKESNAQAPSETPKTNEEKNKSPQTKSESDPIGMEDLNLPDSIAVTIAYHHRASLHHVSMTYDVLIFLLFILVVGFFCSWSCYVNIYSLGPMYGNRLTQAYLGASNPPHAKEESTFAVQNEDDCVHYDNFDRYENGEQRPKLFHIINTALNLTRPSADTLEWQQRKAASFVMTPSYCGSAETGYTSTQTYDDTNGGITIGRAIAVSGAAVSSNMGYHSSRFVSMLLAFFNIRLGYWAQNPNAAQSRPIGMLLLCREFASRIDAKSRHVYLSDGGHFENLGLYEMIRRRCKRILVVDAGHDPDYRYEDLENAIRKIRTDFGVQIIPETAQLTPELARNMQRHSMMARVIYPTEDGKPNEEGRILLLKPVLSGDEYFDLLRYAEATRSKAGTDANVFPQHPTSDQFFDESQFESYRALGQHSVMMAFANNQDWPKLDADAFERAELEPQYRNIAEHRAQASPLWAPPTETTGFSQSLFQTLGATGQSALLASAITMTGVIGVSGAVSLMNPKVSIDEASRQLSGTVALLPPEMKVSFDGNPQDNGLAEKVYALDKEVNRLRAQIDEFMSNKSKSTPDLGALAEEFKKILDNLQSITTSLSQSTGNTAATSAKIAEITRQLSEDIATANRLVGSIDSKGGAGEKPIRDVLERLNKIEQDLKDVSSDLKRNSPRNNTRSAQP